MEFRRLIRVVREGKHDGLRGGLVREAGLQRAGVSGTATPISAVEAVRSKDLKVVFALVVAGLPFVAQGLPRFHRVALGNAVQM